MKKSYHLNGAEKETYVRFSAVDDKCILDTLESKWVRHMDKLCNTYPDEVKCIRRDSYGAVAYEFPKKFVSVRAPKKCKPLSEERKRQLTQVLAAYRNSKQQQ